MELITYTNPNFRTMENVLFFAKKEFPLLSSVYFVDVESQVCANDRIELVRKIFGQQAKIAFQQLGKDDLQKSIPSLLVDRVNVNRGRDKIVVDITNGKTTMSCVLYAAASLIQLPHVFSLYLNPTAFQKKTEEILESEKVITLLPVVQNTNEIGKIGLFEILYYKDRFETCFSQLNIESIKSDFLRKNIVSHISLAIEQYFNQNYASCVHAIGNVVEALALELCYHVKQKAVGAITNKEPNNASDAINWLKTNLVQPLQAGLANNNAMPDYLFKLKYLVTVDSILDQLRKFRNFANHPYDDFQGQSDAGVALSATMYLFESVIKSKVFERCI